MPSKLSECLGAGTGCGWCRQHLHRLWEQSQAGETPSITDDPDQYLAKREQEKRTKNSEPLALANQSQYDLEMAALAPPPPTRIPLSQLRTGERARVDCSSLSDLPEGERCLLQAMGMGDRCELKRCSGHGCIIQIDRTRIAVGSTLADRVFVERLNDRTAHP